MTTDTHTTNIGALFRSTEELTGQVSAVVSGELPNWLQGDFYSIGPALFDINDEFTVNHWCDGFGLVYKFGIRDGKVDFRKKFVESDAYKKAKKVGKPVYTEFGTKAYSDTTKSLFQKFVTNVMPELTDNETNTIYRLGKTLYVGTESHYKRKLDPKTLETGEKVDLSQLLKLNLACSHVYYDPDGTAYTMGTVLSTGLKSQIIKIPVNDSKPGQEYKNSQVLATIPCRWRTTVSYSHSFGVSENFIAFIDQPLFMAGVKLLTAHVKGNCMIDCMEWKPEEKNQFVIVDKKTGNVSSIQYESDEPFFFFHHINTYQEDDQLIIDIIAHDSPGVIQEMYIDKLRNGKAKVKDLGTARRYVLPLIDNIKNVPEDENLIKSNHKNVKAIRKGNKIIVSGVQLTEPAYDFPTVNPANFGKKYKYFYATGNYTTSKYKNTILKINVDTGEVLTWKESGLSFPGEPLFIPSPAGKAEDDGVLLVGVTDLEKDSKDYLLILDASDLHEIARATVSCHVPFLLHTTFVPVI